MGAGSLDHVGVYYELGGFEFSTIQRYFTPRRKEDWPVTAARQAAGVTLRTEQKFC